MPFTAQTLGFKFFQQHKRDCWEKYIKLGMRQRHTHCQLDIIAMQPTVTDEDILHALSAVMIQADEVGFDWTRIDFRHEQMEGWPELVRPRVDSARDRAGRVPRRKQRGGQWVPKAVVGGVDPSQGPAAAAAVVGGVDPSQGPVQAEPPAAAAETPAAAAEPPAAAAEPPSRHAEDDVGGVDPGDASIEPLADWGNRIRAPVPVYIGSFGWRTLGSTIRRPSPLKAWHRGHRGEHRRLRVEPSYEDIVRAAQQKNPRGVLGGSSTWRRRPHSGQQDSDREHVGFQRPAVDPGQAGTHRIEPPIVEGHVWR